MLVLTSELVKRSLFLQCSGAGLAHVSNACLGVAMAAGPAACAGYCRCLQDACTAAHMLLSIVGAVGLATSHMDLPRTEENSTQGMPVQCRLDASPACQQHVLVSPGRALGGT